MCYTQIMLVKCLNCQIEFEALRDTAKFHNTKCRVQYARKAIPEVSVTTSVTENPQDVTLKPVSVTKPPVSVTDKISVTKETEKKGFITPDPPSKNQNVWERTGFPDKDRAALYALALTMKRVPDATISWKGKLWTKKDISKELLRAVEPLY